MSTPPRLAFVLDFAQRQSPGSPHESSRVNMTTSTVGSVHLFRLSEALRIGNPNPLVFLRMAMSRPGSCEVRDLQHDNKNCFADLVQNPLPAPVQHSTPRR